MEECLALKCVPMKCWWIWFKIIFICKAGGTKTKVLCIE